MNAKRKRFLNPAIGNPAGHSSVPFAFSVSVGTTVTAPCMVEISVYSSKMSYELGKRCEEYFYSFLSRQTLCSLRWRRILAERKQLNSRQVPFLRLLRLRNQSDRESKQLLNSNTVTSSFLDAIR